MIILASSTYNEFATLLFSVYVAIFFLLLSIMTFMLAQCRKEIGEWRSEAKEIKGHRKKVAEVWSAIKKSRKRQIGWNSSLTTTMEELAIRLEESMEVVLSKISPEPIVIEMYDGPMERLRLLRASLTLEARLRKLRYAPAEEISWADLTYIEEHAKPVHVFYLRERLEECDLSEINLSRLQEIISRLNVNDE